MCGVQSVSLMSHCDHLLFIFNLIWVRVACCSRNSHLVLLDVEYETILAHECAAHKNFVASIEFLYSQTVLVVLVPVEVLTWIPF